MFTFIKKKLRKQATESNTAGNEARLETTKIVVTETTRSIESTKHEKKPLKFSLIPRKLLNINKKSNGDRTELEIGLRLDGYLPTPEAIRPRRGSFCRFGILPQELQLEIWKKTFFQSRLIILGKPDWHRDSLSSEVYCTPPGSEILPPNFLRQQFLRQEFTNGGFQRGCRRDAHWSLERDLFYLVNPREIFDAWEFDGEEALPFRHAKRLAITEQTALDSFLHYAVELQLYSGPLLRKWNEDCKKDGGSFIIKFLTHVYPELEELVMIVSDERELVQMIKAGKKLTIQRLDACVVEPQNEYLRRMCSVSTKLREFWILRKFKKHAATPTNLSKLSKKELRQNPETKVKPLEWRIAVIHEEGRPYGKDGRMFRW